jgi:hypothetical protein
MKKKRETANRTAIPPGVKVQLARLFGSQTKIAKQEALTKTEWKNTMRQILKELEKYIWYNVYTDEMHMYMLYTGLLAAQESLKQEDFWAGYTEGILRIVLILMGDYPNHKKRRGSGKRKNHYDLQQFRTLHYIQSNKQKLNTLLAVPIFGLPKLENNPNDALHEYLMENGFDSTYKKFFLWYKKKYGKDYALIF